MDRYEMPPENDETPRAPSSLPERRARWSRRGTRPAALALAAGLALFGCGRNGGTLPLGFVPEGVTGADNFIVVVLDSLRVDSTTIAPAVRIRIFDRTSADGYVVYRQSGDESYDEATPYVAQFIGSFNQGYEVYEAIDRVYEPTRPVSYIARATVFGRESRSSPLTEVAQLPPGPFDAIAPDSFQFVAPVDTAMTDSLPLMQWEPVAGAERYLLVIQRADRRLFFLGLTPPNGMSSYRIGSNLGIRLQDTTLTPSTFFWEVSALNATGRVIGETPGRQIFQVVSSGPMP